MSDISAFLPQILSAAVVFAIGFGLARAGHARTAWWLPGGIGVLTLIFVFLGVRFGGQTGPAVISSMLALGVPAMIAGVAGILLGRRRA